MLQRFSSQLEKARATGSTESSTLEPIHRGSSDPSVYVGYLITANTDIVEILSSPFANPANGNVKDISHLTIYGRGAPQEVPEPATLALLGLGLMGAGMARRRKAQA